MIALLSTALLLLWPAAMIEVWPWRLTPLTARILGCFGAQLGVAAAILAIESRWSSGGFRFKRFWWARRSSWSA